MSIFRIICTIIVFLSSISAVNAYVNSTHSYTCNSGYTSCSVGTVSGGGGCPGSFSCITTCGTDLYWNGSSCSGVGTGYYSPSGSDSKIACSNKPSNTSAYNYYYTSDGNGSNNCGYSSTALCNTDYYSSNGSNNIAVGAGYYSPSSNCSRSSCTNKPSNNASRNYYYTSDGNGSNSCSYSYSASCGIDQYESSIGTCSGVGIGYYSPSSNNNRYPCTGLGADTASRNYYWSSDGNGSNSCSQTYADKCGTDLYESSNGVCSAVGIGNYSPNPHNTRFNCTNKPANSYYTGDGNGTNNCTWSCDAGWSKNATQTACIDTTDPTPGVISYPGSYSPSSWTNGDVTVTVSCSDGETGCTSPTFSTTESTNGAGTLYVYDIAGNSAGRAYNVTNIDKLDPNGSVTYSTTAWTNSPVTVTITCTDENATAQYGKSNCDMSYNNTGWGISGNSYTRTFSSNTSGNITIKDIAGNTKVVNYSIANIDTSIPTVDATNHSATAWRNSLININLTRSDSGGSGFAYSKYIWDGSDASCRTSGTSFVNSENINFSTIPGNKEGTHTLYLCARDTAGNNSTPWNNIYKYDTTDPVVSDNYVLDGDWTNVGTTIILSPNDPNPTSANSISGINTTKYCWGTSCNPSSGTVGTSIAVVPDIENRLRYQTWDDAGNASIIGNIDVWIENNDPDTTMSFNRLGFGTVYTPDSWVNYDVRGVINCTDVNPPSSGCDNSTRQYRVQTSSFTCDSTGTWTNYNGTGVDMTETPGNESVRYICSRIMDIATNGYVYSPVYTVRIDKDIPEYNDLIATLPVPNDNSKLLADIHNVIVTAVRDGGAPITLIEGRFENSGTTNSYGGVLQSTADLNATNAEVLSINADMTNVDLDRHADGYRQYRLKITKIEDEAGNVITDPLSGGSWPDILYYVFANASILSTHEVTTNELNVSTNIADGTDKDLIITLKDTHGNEIVPASDINREIDFNFDVSNNLALNQFNSTGDAVFLDRPANPGVFNNRLSSTALLTDEPSSNGTYKYTFNVYTPTYLSGTTDGRQWANGDMTIHNIDYDIRQDSIPSTGINASYSGSVDNSNIEFLFKPLYQAKFTGDLSLGIFADTVQSAVLDIIKVTSPVSVSSSSVRLGFGQTNGANNNVVHPNYDFIYDPDSVAVTVNEGHQLGNIMNLYNLGTLPGTKNFDVKITHVNGSVDPSLPTYISSHIQYYIGGIGPIIYDTNVIGKPRYVDGTNLLNTSQVGLKVMGRIQSKNQTDITTGQSGTDLYALGNNSKSTLKELIRKQTTLEIKNIAGATSGVVTDLTGNVWSLANLGTRLRNNTILYYDLVPGTNLHIGNGSDLVASGIKTIIARGGNVYIKNNITYLDNSSDMLGIISMEDDLGNGGNIYLDPDVTHLSGIYYADKALISYDGTNEIDGSVGTSILKNQFYLYGTLFSENTIGGSIIPKCPYYVPNALCDTNEARKYDLNFLRRYFTYEADGDGIEDDIYNSGIGYFSYGNPNFKYPMVIEYNPNVQTTPPPLFENSQF